MKGVLNYCVILILLYFSDDWTIISQIKLKFDAIDEISELTYLCKIIAEKDGRIL